MTAFKLTVNDLKPYFIPAGSHKAFPSTGKEVVRSDKLRAFEILVVIDRNKDFPFDYKFTNDEGKVIIDPDIYDTHKLAGFHLNCFPWHNAKDALLFGWRQFNETTLEFLPYINKDWKFEVGNGVLSQGNDLIRAYYERVEKGSKKWKVIVRNDTTKKEVQSIVETRIDGYWWFGTKMRTMERIWHGGQNDDESTPYGGVAPVPIKIGMAMDIITY